MSISKFGTTNNSSSTSNSKNVHETKVSKSGDTMYGDLDLNSHKITHLSNPEDETDGVNKGFLDHSISNLVSFADSPPIGSSLAVLGADSEGKAIIAKTPIQIQGSRLQTTSESTSFIQLGDGLILRGIAYPLERFDAVSRQYFEDNTHNFVTKRYFKRNSYRPKFHIFTGSNSDNTEVSSNEAHTLSLIMIPVDGNDFLHFSTTGGIFLNSGVENNFFKVNVSGFVRTPLYRTNDKIEISLVRIVQGENDHTETQTLGKVKLKPEFNCFNFSCLFFQNNTDNEFNLEYNVVSRARLVRLEINATIMFKMIETRQEEE